MAMGLAAAVSPGDEPTPQRPQDIVRKASKQVGMMGFLKPQTDAEKLAKEQQELAKFNADLAAKHVLGNTLFTMKTIR